MAQSIGRARLIVGACLYFVVRRHAAIARQICPGDGPSTRTRSISGSAI